jgi:hypothetical protein
MPGRLYMLHCADAVGCASWRGAHLCCAAACGRGLVADAVEGDVLADQRQHHLLVCDDHACPQLGSQQPSQARP